jgi:AraC family transcriptional activator of pobA
VGVVRFTGPWLPTPEPDGDHAHAHEFIVLAFFARGGGSLRLGAREWGIEAGDAFVIAPGEVVGSGRPEGLGTADAWGVFFTPDVLAADEPGSLLSWRSHPLLFPFVGGVAGAAQRLRVPAADRPVWVARLSALETELRERRDGSDEAVRAHLTLLLVGVSRLAADVVGHLRLRDEPLLADVFAFIEDRYAEPISLRHVAGAVSVSPGHLTTVVRRKTGQTVQRWIAERRMAEAQRLLAETELTVDAIAGRVGYRDAGYFIKHFRRDHGVTPLAWRRAGRAGG